MIPNFATASARYVYVRGHLRGHLRGHVYRYKPTHMSKHKPTHVSKCRYVHVCVCESPAGVHPEGFSRVGCSGKGSRHSRRVLTCLQDGAVVCIHSGRARLSYFHPPVFCRFSAV